MLGVFVCVVFLLSLCLCPLVICQQSASVVIANYTTPYPDLQSLSSLVVTSTGLLFIADTFNNRVYACRLMAHPITCRGQTPTLWYTRGIDVDCSDNLYFASTDSIVVLQVNSTNSVLANHNMTIINPALRGPLGVAADFSGRT